LSKKPVVFQRDTITKIAQRIY